MLKVRQLGVRGGFHYESWLSVPPSQVGNPVEPLKSRQTPEAASGPCANSSSV